MLFYLVFVSMAESITKCYTSLKKVQQRGTNAWKMGSYSVMEQLDKYLEPNFQYLNICRLFRFGCTSICSSMLGHLSWLCV